MSDLDSIGVKDNWTCWLCDEPVDPNGSVNNDRGPSADGFFVAKAKKGDKAVERLAHRACNTMKGKFSPEISWPSNLMVFEPAAIIATVERLVKKGGKEAVGRCADKSDADNAVVWLLDRLSRFAPETTFTTEVTPGGGQFVLMLKISK
jgi:hypothetical protein